MAYRRRTKQGEQPEQNDPEHATRTLFEPTRTDSLFEASKPNYYKFSDTINERECPIQGCGKKFKTRLQLLRYCSPAHQRVGESL